MIQLRQHWRSSLGLFVVSAGLTYYAWTTVPKPDPVPAEYVAPAPLSPQMPSPPRHVQIETYRPDGMFFVAGHRWPLCQLCREKE
jgi:hypothetical protein